jgi:hypothetical protein
MFVDVMMLPQMHLILDLCNTDSYLLSHSYITYSLAYISYFMSYYDIKVIYYLL